VLLFRDGRECRGKTSAQGRLARALLLVGPAFVALLVSVNVVRAAEECRAKPGPTAPPGSRWLYRINRADHRHCWFLSSNATGAHSQVSRRPRHLTDQPSGLQRNQQTDNDVQTGSLPAEKDHVAVTAELLPAPQVASPSVTQSSETIIARSIPTVAFRVQSANSPSVQEPAVNTRAQSATPKAPDKSNVALLAGAAAAGLLFAGGVFHLTRRVQRRAETHLAANRLVVAGPPVDAMPLTPDQAENVTQSVCKVSRDQQRGRENWPLSNETRQYAVVSLPHAATWLGRAESKPRRPAARPELADA
jgi:hypothetical protein